MAQATQIDIPTSQPGAVADEHLAAALAWLHRLLAWKITTTRQTFGALADDPYRGLYISDSEVDMLGSDAPRIWPEPSADRVVLADERRALDARARPEARLARLAASFGLDRFDCDVVLLALAPELDLRYERILGYIQDDVTKKRPTVGLALGLLCVRPDQALAARARFAPEAPLLRQRLIHVFEEGQRHAPLPARLIKLDERIVAELIGQPAIDPSLAPFVALTQPRGSLDQLALPDDLRARLRRIVHAYPPGLTLALQGSYGSGRTTIAEALCAEADLPLLRVYLDRLLESDLAPEDSAQRLVREAALQRAAIFWQHGDRLLHGDSARAWRAAILGALDEHSGVSFFALDQPWEARGALKRAPFLRVELPTLSYAEREQVWRQQLGAETPAPAALEALASTFRLTGGQIRDAAAMARALAGWRNGADGAHDELAVQDLYAACRAQSSGRLGTLAQRIAATYHWDDIVLPADQASQLREICVQVRQRRTVLERWGFDRHLAMGKGVNVLFAGQSGTGKTMAAEIIASDLELELYKVDLSSLVSKYIGETEKNLDAIFTAAREANAILFFDEADAIFGKRSEVKDAHDRYANIEVGYLLQKMEEYDGVVILATNLRKNMDDAFVRRLHVAIDFPFPEEADRLRIWRKVFPPEAPLETDIDLAFMARQFRLAGGNIRNIALLAAFLAAEDGTAIGMAHVIRAARREYQKLGKLVTEADFGPYIAIVKREPVRR
jgi:AAA+ superfamily predicted ATPase